MSTVLILTPVIIASWPAISTAAVGAAAALGFMIKNEVQNTAKEEMRQEEVEIELAKSSVAAQNAASIKELILNKGDIELRVNTDSRGRCVVCAKGLGYTKEQLTETAEEFGGKLTQIFTYNKVMTELRSKGFNIASEEMQKDDSIRINVRHNMD
jgi:hypothetical protein